VVFYESKPSIISISIQGDIIQSSETPTYERTNTSPQYVNNKVSNLEQIKSSQLENTENTFNERRFNQSNSSTFNPNQRL